MIANIRRYWRTYAVGLLYIACVAAGGYAIRDGEAAALIPYFTFFLAIPVGILVIDEAAAREAARKARNVILEIERRNHPNQAHPDKGTLVSPTSITIHMPTPRSPSPGEIDEAYEMVQTWAENLAGAEEEQQ